MAYQMAFFAANTLEKLKENISAGKVSYPAYVFIRDEGADTGRLAFIDQGNVIKLINDGEESAEQKKQVVKVDALPETGDVETLYILDGIVYVFDGTEFKAQYVDHTAELEALDERITIVEESLTDLADEVVKLDEKAEHSYEKVKYEFTDVPVGTLVDYREDEIRIMCPDNAEFTQQTVGAGGDANCYYGTLKTYAPDDATGYIEHLGDQVDAEILTDLKTDTYGRKYQPTWLALARYDETTGWAYYGSNSTIEKFIGWDYQIDWYNADGIMIASDKIRINLSNENCHSVIEPFYVNTMKSDIDTLKEAVEQLESNSGLTFIELE